MPPTHLIILCCHAIFDPALALADPYRVASWHLAPFQKPAEHLTFCQHLFVALFHLDALNRLEPASAALVISGGRTKRGQGVEGSEAGSYLEVAERLGWLEGREEWGGRVDGGKEAAASMADVPGASEGVKVMPLLEELATDSYQNLLFSILAFMKRFGRAPNEVTIVTHAFKEHRFLECHGPAIRWPKDRLKVIGVNPPQTATQFAFNQRGEHDNAVSRWETDLYGTGEVLAAKRKQRGWDDAALREAESLVDNPEIVGLLNWEGGPRRQEVYAEALPWSTGR